MGVFIYFSLLSLGLSDSFFLESGWNS